MNAVEVAVVFIAAYLPACWLTSNLVGWLVNFGRHGERFNWRVLLGPGAYIAWLDLHSPGWWRK